MLLEHSADVNHADNIGTTALMLAAHHDYIEIVNMLLEHGANVNDVHKFGFTALLAAACSKHTEMLIRMLVRYGANIPSTLSAQDRDSITQAIRNSGVSLLALAIITRDRESITRLLSSCAIGARYEFGMTVLHWAVTQNYEALVEDLLANYNLNLNVQDEDGNAPLHYAARNGNDVALQVLIAHSASINAVDNDGNTALHLAIRQGHAGAVQALIAAGADHIIRNTRNQTPLELAYEYRNDAIIDMLNREIIIPEILRDQQLFEHLRAQGRNVPAIGMSEEIIARIVGFLSNPNSNVNS